jgi:hypothetical protein
MKRLKPHQPADNGVWSERPLGETIEKNWPGWGRPEFWLRAYPNIHRIA